MPRVTTALYKGRDLHVDEALPIRDAARRRGDQGRLLFQCRECGRQVYVTKGSSVGSAHFEHFPDPGHPPCSLRDPRWGRGVKRP